MSSPSSIQWQRAAFPERAAQGCRRPAPGGPGEEECFHDASASFETEEPGADKLENKPEDDMNPSELDEEYLMELEKNMPDEEKKRRREESSRLKEEGNEQFKKGDYIEAESSILSPADVSLLLSERPVCSVFQQSCSKDETGEERDGHQ